MIAEGNCIDFMFLAPYTAAGSATELDNCEFVDMMTQKYLREQPRSANEDWTKLYYCQNLASNKYVYRPLLIHSPY